MLIQSGRHSRQDIATWATREQSDAIWSRIDSYARMQSRSRAAIQSFVARESDGWCYCGVSWGKDSVVAADLVSRYAPGVPIVWVRVDPDYNPDCLLVRDEFLRTHPSMQYEEVVVTRDPGPYRVHGTLESGMQIAAEKLGATRYISGVRADESAVRKARMRNWGESTLRTCAPIGWWTARDVFAYLHARGLPVHPAYACSMDGMLDRARIRVGPLGGPVGERPGDNWGRVEWERRYYGRRLDEIERAREAMP